MAVVVHLMKQFIAFFFITQMICKYLYCVCIRVEEEGVKERKNGRTNNGPSMFQSQTDTSMKFYHPSKHAFSATSTPLHEALKIFLYVNNK